MPKRSLISNLPSRCRDYRDNHGCNSRGFKHIPFSFSRYRRTIYSGFRKLGNVRNTRGQALLSLIFVVVPLTFLVFAPIFYNNQMDIYDKGKARFYAYLDRIQVEGYLTVEDENAMRDEFEMIDCPIVDIDCPRESQGDVRILRNDSVANSLINVKIRCQPEQNGLNIGGLVGAGNPSDYYINLEGSVISERVDP
ncbi:MAG: hypothetical protein FH756_00380 [Firmicutes bacterium]|nr:hypothetical protein [Bacillota bacterium]